MGNINKDTDDKKDILKEELLKQLHEQYAINNNSNLSSAVALFSTLLIVVGFYGYMFVHSSVKFTGLDEMIQCDSYNLDAFLLSTVTTLLVIGCMIWICLYQGFSQRKAQFITDAIRKNYNLLNTEEEKIFPENYHPFCKKGLEIFQGLFGEFVKMFIASFVLIVVSSIAKILYISKLDSYLPTLIISCIVIVVSICIFLVCIFFKFITRYHETEKEYLSNKIELNANTTK